MFDLILDYIIYFSTFIQCIFFKKNTLDGIIEASILLIMVEW